MLNPMLLYRMCSCCSTLTDVLLLHLSCPLQILEEARAIEERRAKELGAQPTPAARRPGGGPGGAAKTPGAASPAGGAGAGSSMAVTSADFKFPAEYPNDVVPSLFSAAGVQPIRPTKGGGMAHCDWLCKALRALHGFSWAAPAP